jgi:hypothetical protein
VDVHIPQAGDQEFATAIDDLGAARGFDLLADLGDADAGDGYIEVFTRRGAGRVDDRDVLDYERLSEETGAKKTE